MMFLSVPTPYAQLTASTVTVGDTGDVAMNSKAAVAPYDPKAAISWRGAF
jgi:hypothetical protein